MGGSKPFRIRGPLLLGLLAVITVAVSVPLWPGSATGASNSTEALTARSSSGQMSEDGYGARLSPKSTEVDWGPARPEKVAPEVTDALSSTSSVSVIVSLAGQLAPSTSPVDVGVLANSIAASAARVLASVPGSEFKLVQQYQAVPALAGDVTLVGVTALAANPYVVHVALNRKVQASLAQAVPLIGADDVHNLLSITGEGVVVAVLDSGIDTDHPFLMGDINHEQCFLAGGGCPGAGTTGPSAEDDYGHGSHVSGIITSTGPPVGIAPDALIDAFKVLDSFGSGVFSDIILAYDDIILNHTEVDLINMSLGDGGSYAPGTCEAFIPAMTAAVATTRAMGITSFAASGNNGSKTGIGFPACINDIVSVGAVYDANVGFRDWSPTCTDTTTVADQVVCFSQSNISLDLLAPGSTIDSTDNTGGALNASGTSMSSPAAAASAALLLESEPLLTPAAVQTRLTETGVPVTDAVNGVTTCRVDAYEAVLNDGGPVCASAGPPPPTCPGTPSFSFSVPDPAGDNFGSGSPNHDITSVDGEGDASVFCLTIGFSGPVDPADAASGLEVVGVIEFDTDQSAGTGLLPFMDFSCANPSGMGVEATLDMFGVSGGFGLLNGSPVPVTFGSTSLTAIIPLFLIGGDSAFNLGMLLGSLAEPTDCAPGNGGCIESPTGIICVPPPPPSNDDFVAAIVIPGPILYSNSQTTVSATTEAGEPSPCGGIASTVWYSFTPSTSNTVTLDTFGSAYDTVLAVYTGPSVGSLALAGCNDDTGGLQSEVQFSATAGTTYRIQVGGFFGSTGDLVLNMFVPIACNQGVNNDFELGIVDSNRIPCWTVVDQSGGSWCTQAGTAPPQGACAGAVTTVPAPPQGAQAVMTNTAGPGSHVLYRCNVLASGSVGFRLYINNLAGGFSSPPTLDPNTVPNQQFRADLVTKAGIEADPFTVAPSDILLNLYQTLPGDPPVSGYTPVAADISAFIGQNVCLRFAEVDNESFFHVGIDDVQFELKKKKPGDTDGDGCADVHENGPDETLGGLRDYKNPHDFYDVNGDLIIDLSNDILGVIMHYAPAGPGSGDYDVKYDRGPSAGPNPWNMTAPDGVIDLSIDIFGTIQQYNHDCQ